MIVFAHGLEGSPHGMKPSAMRDAGLEVVAPDFSGMVLQDRIVLLQETLKAHPQTVLCGSSYGGLASAYVAHHESLSITGLLLLAPALGLKEPPVKELGELCAPPGIPTVIIHGVDDSICPIADSRAYVGRSHGQTQLLEVNDGHRLSQSVPRILDALNELGA